MFLMTLAEIRNCVGILIGCYLRSLRRLELPGKGSTLSILIPKGSLLTQCAIGEKASRYLESLFLRVVDLSSDDVSFFVA